MIRHRRALGVLFLLMAAIICVAVVSIESANPFDTLSRETQISLLGALLVGLWNLAAGYALLVNLAWASRVCVPLSVVSLFTFPIGTAIGAYYLWFYFRSKNASNT